MALINRTSEPEWQPQGLDYNRERLAVIIDQPAAVCTSNTVYIGPTAVDLNVVVDERALGGRAVKELKPVRAKPSRRRPAGPWMTPHTKAYWTSSATRYWGIR